MSGRWHIFFMVGVLAMIVGAVGVYAWDGAQDDYIADGVRIGGVDVGGMSAAEASEVVRSDVVDPLMRPIEVTYRGKTHELTPSELDMQADIDGMVAEAQEVSRQGSLPTRLVRRLTSGSLNEDVAPRVSYSDRVLDDFVGRVAKSIDRPAQDARIQPTSNSIESVASKTGLKVRRDPMRDQVAAELQTPVGDRTVKASVKTVEPAVTTENLAEKTPYYITVDRNTFQLRFYKDLKLEKTYTVAVGQAGFDTPEGEYHIQNKAENAAWSVPNKPWAGDLAGRTIPGGAPDNPLKARWMGIYDGAGIHGTDQTGSLGSRASHGCIRMAIPDVKELYDQVPTQTPIYIG